MSSSKNSETGEGDGDQKSVLSGLSLGGAFEFLDTSDQNEFKVVLQFSGAVLEFVESLGNGFLVVVGLFLYGNQYKVRA